jgi:predicted dehydrogenase
VVHLITLAPGHFHAALIHKEQLPDVDPHVRVYGPLDGDLLTHLEHLRRFNARPVRPTHWTVGVYAGPDFLDRFRAERPGDTVVIAGRNKPKIDLILAAVSAGLNVLADKPWVIDPSDLPKLDEVFRTADRHGVLAWDVMTERHEVTTRLQRALMATPAVFGYPVRGTVEKPALELESVHYLEKSVAGAPLVRPAWWFDPAVAGTGPADVGTHLADLAMWLLFPDRAIDPRSDIEMLARESWPTEVPWAAFRSITGLPDYPTDSDLLVRPDGGLNYRGNGAVTYRLCDRVVRWTVRWEVGPEDEGDTHFAVARGTRAEITVRHVAAFGPGPQLFLRPVAGDLAGLAGAAREGVEGWGATADIAGDEVHVAVPADLRAGHEAHFGAVLTEFMSYVRNPRAVPAWERSNLLAKYAVSTHAGVFTG